MKTRYVMRAEIPLASVLIVVGMLLFSCGESGMDNATDEVKIGEEIAYWTCGMHPSVKAHEPGTCPICNMNLVPVYKEGETEQAHAERKAEQQVLYWTCGMHPSVKADEPGTCPICNMDLVPVYKEAETAGEGEVPSMKISRRAQQLAGIETAEVAYRHVHKKILTVGNVTYDERLVATVTAWIPGRIDTLFVDFTGKEIRKGEPLALIYSPELVSTQEEYILALETLDRMRERGQIQTVRNAESLVESTRRRLLLWGIPEKEVKRLERERKASEHIRITSPVGGTVVEKSVLEGQYVKEGEILYTIADLSNVWVLADIYEYEMGWIKLGQKMEMTSLAYPGEVFDGEVIFIDPVLHEQTRSVKIRADVRNPDRRLKPGMFVNVTFTIHLTQDLFPGLAAMFDDHGRILSVPVSAVLQTGVRSIIYEEVRDGEYIGRTVQVGPKAGEFYPILAGLDEGSRVVTRGNFLLDSQSQLTGLEAAAYDAALGEKKAAPGHRH